VQQILGGRRPVDLGDTLVVDVGTTFADGAAGRTLRLLQSGTDEQVEDRRIRGDRGDLATTGGDVPTGALLLGGLLLAAGAVTVGVAAARRRTR